MKIPPTSSKASVEAADVSSEEIRAQESTPPAAGPTAPPPAALLGLAAGRRPTRGGFLSRIPFQKAPVAAALLGTLLFSGPALAQSRTDAPPPAVVATYIGHSAQLGAPLFSVADAYVDAMSNQAMAQLRPEALFDQVQEGKLIVQVPLRPGEYDVQGTRLKVHEGTVVYATVEIQDGRLVPYDDGDGTRVQLTRPIDGPVWTTAHGVFLKAKQGGRGQAMIDVAGWFDKALGQPTDLAASNVIRQLMDNIPDAQGAAAFPVEMVDWDGLRFQLDPVRMGDGVVDMGGITLDLAQGSHLSIVGNIDAAHLRGRFALDEARVRQPGLQMDLVGADLQLELSSRQHADGRVEISGGFHELSGQVRRFVADHTDPSGTTAHVDLQDVTLQGARLDLDATLSGLGRGQPNLLSSSYHFQGDISGVVGPSTARVLDKDGTADLAFSANRIEGHLHASGQGVALTGRLDGAQVEVRDLQQSNDNQTFDMRSARVRGDAQLSFDTRQGTYSAFVNAEQLNVVLDDLVGTEGAKIDLGRTELAGSGRLWLGPQDLRIEGDIGISGQIDDLVVHAKAEDGTAAKTVFDVARGSTMQGRLRRLEVHPDAPLLLDVDAAVQLDLDDHAFELPGFTADGPTSLDGQARLRVQDHRVSLEDASLVATMTLSDGALAAGKGALALDLAQGSTLKLAIAEAAFGGPDGLQPALRLGAGSHLEARLDGGHVDIAQRRVEFLPGTLVRFELASLERQADGSAELLGSLYLDAPVNLAPLVDVNQLEGLLGDGGLGLRIEGVRLGSDGKLTMEGIDLSFEGTIGQVERVSPGTDRARLATLLAAHPEISTQQELINYFYTAGGDWAGASRAAQAYGLDLARLTEERSAPAHAQLTGDRPAAATYLQAPLQVPSLEAIKNASAGDLLHVETNAAPLDILGISQRIQDGKLTFTLPLEGTYGTWPNSVTFEEGTVLTVRAEARGGELVEGSFEAGLSSSGDAALWTTLDGAYLDEDRNLMLDVGWWFDSKVEGFEALPSDLGGLIERLMTGAQGAAEAGSLSSIADFSQARVQLDGITLEEGRLPFQVGHIDLAEGTKISVSGTRDDLRIHGRLESQGLAVDTDAFAIDAAGAEAQLELTYRRTPDGGSATRIAFDRLELDGRGLVYRSDEGALIQLGAGEASGRVVIDVETDSKGSSAVATHFSLDAFDGQVEAMRMRLDQGGAPAPLEIGPSRFSGSVALLPNGSMQLHGHASSLDARFTNVLMPTAAGDVRLDQARIGGSGVLVVDGPMVTFLGGSLEGAAQVDADEIQLEDVFPGYLRDIQAKDGKATFRFDFEHVDRVQHGPGVPFVLEGARGRLGGSVQIQEVQADVEADPFRSGVLGDGP